MADDGAMGSLLAAVEAAAANTSAVHFAASSPPPAQRPLPCNTQPHPSYSIPTRISMPPPPIHPRLAPLQNLSLPPSAALSASAHQPPPLPAKTASTAPPFHHPPNTFIPPPPLPPPIPSTAPAQAQNRPPPQALPPPPLPVPSPPQPQTPNQISGHNKVTVQEASLPPPPFTDKRKGARIFTLDEKRVLEANYARNKFPSRLHMQTLARAMGKGTEKVRTWYNNRRALDRKLGIEVHRNGPENQSLSPNSLAAIVKQQPDDEEPVILPSCVIASPPTNTALKPQESAASPSPGASDSRKVPAVTPPHCANDAGLVNVTPSAIAWAPCASPVTVERNAQYTPATSPDTAQANRFRMSPLRIRNGRLLIGQKEICGELSENPAADCGLEIKFLFGKKRIVYEWYCGQNYAEAQATGGPYAKMEMSFDNVSRMQLFKSATRSVLEFTFSTRPTLFLQTKESMDKYKARAQQRQYRKVRPEDFPIPIVADYHHIWMQSAEAVRVSRILIEDTPRLGDVFQKMDQHQGFTSATSFRAPSFSLPAVQRGEMRACSSALAALSMTRNNAHSPSAQPPQSLPMIPDLPRSRSLQAGSNQAQRTGELMSPAPLAVEQDGRSPVPTSHELPIVQPTTAAGAAANLVASPAPWCSPATPFISSTRGRRDEPGMNWLSSRFPSSAATTPFSERGGFPGTPKDEASRVRRELNFNSAHRYRTEASILRPHASTPASPHSPSRKRKAHHINHNENDVRSVLRRHSSPRRQRVPLQALQFSIPEPPPLPPHLKFNVTPKREPSSTARVVTPQDVNEEGGIHSLPR